MQVMLHTPRAEDSANKEHVDGHVGGKGGHDGEWEVAAASSVGHKGAAIEVKCGCRGDDKSAGSMPSWQCGC